MPLRPSKDLLTFEEIERIVRVLAAGGVRRVRITGGEPLVRRELTELATTVLDVGGESDVRIETVVGNDRYDSAPGQRLAHEAVVRAVAVSPAPAIEEDDRGPVRRCGLGGCVNVEAMT